MGGDLRDLLLIKVVFILMAVVFKELKFDPHFYIFLTCNWF